MAAEQEDKRQEVKPEDAGEIEDPGGGRFNPLLLVMGVGIAMIVGVVAIEGIRSAGVTAQTTSKQASEDGTDAARDKAEVEDLAARGRRPEAAPSPAMPAAVVTFPARQTQIQRTARTPSRYAQWAEDKYMKALEAPEMVSAFHSGGTLEIARRLPRL